MYSQGKQIGTYRIPESSNDIQITLEPNVDPRYRRITDGVLEEYNGYALFKDVYDTRQGSMVGGIILCDATGYPLPGEEYKLSDFTWSGNISSGKGEIIPLPFNFL